MKIHMADGEAQVYVIHSDTLPRTTTITVKLPDGGTFAARSTCGPHDQFVKRTGRILATRRLAALLADHEVSRPARQQILGAVWRKG